MVVQRPTSKSEAPSLHEARPSRRMICRAKLGPNYSIDRLARGMKSSGRGFIVDQDGRVAQPLRGCTELSLRRQRDTE